MPSLLRTRFCIAVVTLYATLGEEAIVYGINQAEVEVVITDGHLLPKLQAVAAQLTNIKTIIYIGDVDLKALSTAFPSHVNVLSMAEVEKIGARSKNSKWIYQTMIVCIMQKS